MGSAFSMKRLVFAGLAALLLGLPGAPAQGQPPSCVGVDLLDELSRTDPAAWSRVRADAARSTNQEARLWRVERGAAPPSYLLGTLHSTDPRITALSPALEAAVAATDTIAIEIADPSPSAMLDVFKSDPDMILYMDGRRMAQQLRTSELEVVHRRLENAGLAPELVASLRPWFAYTLLSLPDCERERKAAGLDVLDLVVANAGRRRGHAIVGLESIKEQLAALASVPEAEQLAMLRVSIAWSPRAPDILESVQQRYLRREIGAAWPLQLSLADKAGVPAATFRSFQQKVLIDRNLVMLSRSLPLLARGRALIAVGALHLVGEQGLVALYRQEGYAVTAVE